MLIREKDRAFLEEVGKRENVPVMVMDKITVTGHMVVKESKTGETAVNLDLELMLLVLSVYYVHFLLCS